MKILLTALNSKYIHSNLAVRYLMAYTKKLDYDCVVREFTINDILERVLEEIISEKPNIVAFSCYIWNIEYIKSLAVLIKLVDPKIQILYGGPEVSYDSCKFLKDAAGEYVIIGEGEETYCEFVKFQIENFRNSGRENSETDFLKLKNINGLCFKWNNKIILNGYRKLIDMNRIVFPYKAKEDFQNKIIYYESSRGCPFNCKYCLSSTTAGVRFLNIERVKAELQFLMRKNIKLIKFVDRTFNCNHEFTMKLWKFIIDADTDITFHFEISADILTEDEIELLQRAPAGRIQLEVGVQTTNDRVLNNINRHVEFQEIKRKVKKVEKNHNVKQHLDLIAGLPGEDFSSFKKSFNDVYSVKPEEIQLGFLKLLKGSDLRKDAKNLGIVHSPYAPYEVLKTDNISYEELVVLKRIEKMVDKYYNSGKFTHILNYFATKFKTAFDFYYELGMFFYNSGYLTRNISSAEYYKVFVEFEEQYLKEKNIELNEIIKYDYLKFNKKRWLPDFLLRYRDKYGEKLIKQKIQDKDIAVSKNYYLEKFSINIEKLLKSSLIEKEDGYVVFDGKRELYFFGHI
ncbi:B12-binding domain-containing radical SAM protein [Clostridium sp. MT-14]|uniref:B12-binding domain-containing radical SAM protein n=1 Tax=Clostridium sp. MT-14 TaxID=3348360 RepID=UPI0035F4730C